jgi:serine/threonine protein kinase
MGSPLYMSPEQMVSAKFVDARTDIWSLGVTLFELVTGERPFGGESLTELIANVLQKPPLSLRQLRADISPDFDAALARTLEKERERRYPSVAEFAAAIAPFGPRYAALSVERIAQTLARNVSIGLEATQAATPSDKPALRISQPQPELGGRTTAQPVAHEVEIERSAGQRRLPLQASIAVGALLAISAGAWLVSSDHLSGSQATGSAGRPALDLSVMPPIAHITPSASVTAAVTARASAESAQPTSSAVQPLPSASTTSPSTVPTRRPQIKQDPWEKRNR